MARCLLFVPILVLLVGARARAVENWVTHPESGFVAPAHTGAVNRVVADESGLVLSIGADGFLVIWDSVTMTARERFQLSRYPLEKLSLRPGKSEIAVYESDGFDFYRISVWNYAEKERRFNIPLTSPALYCAYTALGNYLVIGFHNGFQIFDGDSGELRGEKLEGYPVTLAVSSLTERTLQTYSPSGVLAYWDLDKLNLTRSFSVTANLRGPLVFGNYRFLAGDDGDKLFVIDAVSGKTFFETGGAPGGVLLEAEGEAAFTCVSYTGGENEDGGGVLKREDFTVNSAGAVECGETLILLDGGFSAAAALDGQRFLAGRGDGRLALVEEGGPSFFSFMEQTHVLDAAASPSGAIALVFENGYGAFIPGGFEGLFEADSADSIELFSACPANRVSAGSGDAFLFWRRGGEGVLTGSENIFPFVKTPAGVEGLDGDVGGYVIDGSASLKPLRSAAINGDRVLFLDISGGINIFSLKDRRRLFSYTSALSLDAVFSGERGILIACNAEAGSGASPFLLADTVSGETLPAAYPALAAFTLYKDRAGNIYAAVLKAAEKDVTEGVKESVDKDVKTEVIMFDARIPEASKTIFGYKGEDTDFSFVECGDGGERFACNAGGGDAFIVSNGGINAGKTVDRSPAFPQKLLPQKNGAFAALGGEGTLSWYDGATGRLLAMLRFYENEWLLSSANGTVKRGSLAIYARALRRVPVKQCKLWDFIFQFGVAAS